MRAPLVVSLLLAPTSVEALTLLDGTKTSSLSLSVKGQVFVRGRGEKLDGASFERSFDLQRARLGISLRFGPWLRADIEPDFGGAQADLADAFLEVSPVRALDVRAGQMKTPFGVLETMGRWRLPSLRRGLVNDVVFDRMGFRVRRFGARARVRLKDVTLKPTFEIGIYGEQGLDISQTGAARIGVRPIKKLWVHLAGYTDEDAAADGRRGNVGALSVLYDKKRLFVAAEGLVGRARLLARTGLDPGIDASFAAGRLLVAYRVDVAANLVLQPFLGGEIFEPNFKTRDDLSLAARGGVNLFWYERFRLSFEADVQRGQLGSIVVNDLRLSGLVGVAL